MQADADGNNYQMPLDLAREAIADKCELMKMRDKPLPLSDLDPGFKGDLGRSDQADTFSFCFGCETCTTVCPVVGSYDNPREELGLLPHQIMNSCGLGLKDLALGSNMLWDCLTCYQCQEQCPQGVCVTDIIYELKNRAVDQARVS
jgi:heterodisulfide reductase subunit C